MKESSKVFYSLFMVLILLGNSTILFQFSIKLPNDNQTSEFDNRNLKFSAIWASLNLTNEKEINKKVFYVGTTIPISGKVYNRITLEPKPNINVSILANGRLYPNFNDTTDLNGDFEINFTIPLTLKANIQIEIWGRVTDILPGDIEYLNNYTITLLHHQPVYINNNTYTWLNAKADGICTGSGTWLDPYIIENYAINGNNLGSCIKIENSLFPFIIQNCYCYNASSNLNGGINLINVSNSLLRKINCTTNKGAGINLYNSHNNSIVGNDITNNYRGNENGISLYSSHNNLISSNFVYNNSLDGIYLSYSDNNIIFHNIIKKNYDMGIHIESGNNYNITSNRITSNTNQGIGIEGGNNNVIHENIITNNVLEGILILDGINCTISGNNITKNYL